MRPLLPAALLVLTGGLAACSDAPQAERDAAGAVASAGTLGAFSIKLGDCLKEPPAAGGAEVEQVEDVAAVPCSQPHEAEVYAGFELPDGPFPGDPAVSAAADERCTAEFATYVGRPLAESTLEFYTFQPTQSSWNAQKDREVLCVLSDPAGPSTGSLRGAAR